MCITDMIQSGFSIHARDLRAFEKRMAKDVKKFAGKKGKKVVRGAKKDW